MRSRTAATLLVLAATAAPLAAEHPAPTIPDIVDTAVAEGRFSTLATALGAAELVEALKAEGPFTVLAPTGEAFAALPPATLRALLRPENREALGRVLKLHVVLGRVRATDALAAGDARTLAGETLHFRPSDGRLRVGEAGVIADDVEASNGLIHVIDRVLLPADGLDLRPQGRLVIGVYIEKPSKALASQLGLDRNASLVVDSLTRNGPAQEAGLEAYDVIQSINGEPATESSLNRAKQRVGFGGTLKLSILRAGKPRVIDVQVGVERH